VRCSGNHLGNNGATARTRGTAAHNRTFKAPKHRIRRRNHRTRLEVAMSLLLIIILLVILLGGGGFGYSRYGMGGLGGALGLVLVIILILYLLGALGVPR